MCNTAMLSKMRKASCFRHQPRTAAANPQQRRTKRDREVGNDEMPRRPVKRVSFSPSECVLGRAQDYDRTSFEVQRPMLRRRSSSCSTPTSKAAPVPVVISSADDAGDHAQHADFSGTWRRSHGFNWASLLEFSGVDKASIPAQAARMQSSSVVHLIDHDATGFRLVVHSDSGSTQEQHFFIGGQPRPTSVPTPASSTTTAATPSKGAQTPTASTTTLSNMRWTKNGQALVLTSMDAATGDEMTVSRHLASKGAVIVQHYTARRAKTGETAEAITIFRKMVRGEGKVGDSVPQ